MSDSGLIAPFCSAPPRKSFGSVRMSGPLPAALAVIAVAAVSAAITWTATTIPFLRPNSCAIGVTARLAARRSR